MNRKEQQKSEAIAELRDTYKIKVGSGIHTQVLHVSRSGMSRTVGCYVVSGKSVVNVSLLIARATGSTYDVERGGVKMGGCGMDMTFAIVYSLGRAMFPNGHKCTGKDSGTGRCSSNDHFNDFGQASRITRQELGDDVPFDAYRAHVNTVIEREGLNYRKNRMHNDGGYALKRIGL